MVEFYPVTMYNWDGRFIVCSSRSHKEALGKGWYTSAAEAMRAHDEAEKNLQVAMQQAVIAQNQRARRREN
jgi:hypothetical protein